MNKIYVVSFEGNRFSTCVSGVYGAFTTYEKAYKSLQDMLNRQHTKIQDVETCTNTYRFYVYDGVYEIDRIVIDQEI